jgi:central glycolytic genes regulator
MRDTVSPCCIFLERGLYKLRRLIDIQKKLLPDLLELLGKRYRVLKLIRSMQQPIGRRVLAQLLGLTERIVRAETEFLKDQGLLIYSSSGMTLSEDGEHLVDELDIVIRDIFGLQDLEIQLQEALSVRKIIIVPGDSSETPWIKQDLGRAAAEQMKQLVGEDWVVSVTGGSSIAAVAEAITPSPKLRSLLFVPARGGLGEDLENQANTIASKMALKSAGNYRLLHVPDELSITTYESLMSDPQIIEITDLIRSSRMIVHGIGEANAMAKRRKASSKILELLKEKAAVSEAFGYYFNQEGEIIHKIQTIGLRLEDVKNAEHILAVAGGKNKAMAMLSFLKHGFHDVLVTDEGAAREIYSMISKGKTN